MSKEYESILNYWFDDIEHHPENIANRNALWWQKNPESDRYILQHFSTLHQDAIDNKLQYWRDTPKGRLALVILLDQFSRAIYRNDRRAYKQDPLALQLALDGIEKQENHALNPFECCFLYMPLEHAENIELQNQCVALFESLHDNAIPEFKSQTQGFLDFAKAHRDIIEKFGRFPHRNTLLNRKSTSEEIAFLKQPGSSF